MLYNKMEGAERELGRWWHWEQPNTLIHDGVLAGEKLIGGVMTEGRRVEEGGGPLRKLLDAF